MHTDNAHLSLMDRITLITVNSKQDCIAIYNAGYM